MRVDLELTTTDAVFKKERQYKGGLIFLKPHFMILRIENANDPTRTDYEVAVYNGEALYQYSGLEKTVTEWKLPAKSLMAELPEPLSWPQWFDRKIMVSSIVHLGQALSGIASTGFRDRLDLHVFRRDDNYLYLKMTQKRKLSRPSGELRMSIFKPEKGDLAFLPRQVLVKRDNGDKELWNFSNHVINPPDVNESAFQYKPVEGFKLRKDTRAKENGVPTSRKNDPELRLQFLRLSTIRLRSTPSSADF